MNCLPTSKCTEREFSTTKYIVSNCNVIEVTLTQKQNADCTTEFVSLLDADGNSYPENSEFVSVNNQISRVVIEGLSTCASDAMGGGGTIPTVQDCDGNNAVPVYDQCSITAINTAKDAIVAAINGRPDYTTQLTSIGDTLTAIKSDTAAINTGVASSLVLLQAIVDKPDPTPVDLQPVLDKLDSLIALETTENSTLVDIKNQLVAANVTLSNAVDLLTHIDTDMHDVVAKLQSVIDLLTSIQTLLTTIDGHIVAVQSAITTADANNVSALNDVKTALQAININTDTLEALITAGNVLLTSIASNTDEVEGLLTEIRDLPVTDSWFLLYDSVDGGEFKPAIVDETMQSATLQSLASYHPSGQGVVFGPLLQSDDFGKATIQISGLVVGAPVYVYPAFYTYDPAGNPLFSYNIDSVGDITQPEGVQMSFVATAETETLTITMTGQVHDAVEFYNVTAAYLSTGSCTPFIRRIVDDVVTDTEIDLTTPYTVIGEVRTSCSTGESGGGCDCSNELTQIKSVIDDINSKISTPSVSPRSVVYSHKTSAYTANAGYKSLSVSFENDGTVNGQYTPAGYSFTHDYFDGGYAMEVMLDGTSYMVWEGR